MILSRTVQNLKTFDLTWCKTEKRRKNSPENRYYHNLLEKLIIDLSNCWFKLSNEKFYNLFNVFCHRSWNICWFRSDGLISVTMMTHMNAAQSSEIGKKHFVYLSQILIVLHLYLVLFVSKLAGQCDSKLITSFKLFVVDAKWIMMSVFVHLSSLQTVLLDRVSWSSHNQVEDKMM